MAESANESHPVQPAVDAGAQNAVAAPTPGRPAAPSAPPVAPFDVLQSATRLLVGFALIGGDELLKRVQNLEQAISTKPPDPATIVDQIHNSPTGQLIPDDVRHALIGLAFDLEAQVRTSTPRLLAAADQIFTGLTRPAQNILGRIPIVSSWSQSIGSQYVALQRRGEDRLQRWIAIGQREEARSRVLADMTYKQIINDYIDYFADKPEVQNLILGQTTGLTAEVIGEVRETTVSGDSFLEGIVRAVLRKTPRAEVPPPALEIRQAAVVVPPHPLGNKGDEG